MRWLTWALWGFSTGTLVNLWFLTETFGGTIPEFWLIVYGIWTFIQFLGLPLNWIAKKQRRKELAREWFKKGWNNEEEQEMEKKFQDMW